MKKALIISIIAGLAAVSAGCGSISSSSSSDSTSAAIEEVSDEEIAEAETDESEAEEEDEVPSESGEDIASEEEVSIENSGVPSVSIAKSDGSDTVDGISTSYIFDSINGGCNYGDLQSYSLANVAEDGRAYALVDMGGAAGSAYYDLYISDDKGETWANSGTIQELNGEKHRFALEDGSIVTFYYRTAAGEAYPKAFSYRLSGDGLVRTDNETILDSIILDNGSALSSENDYYFTADYIGDNTFRLMLSDADTSGSFYGNLVIDPVTLAVQSIEPLE